MLVNPTILGLSDGAITIFSSSIVVSVCVPNGYDSYSSTSSTVVGSTGSRDGSIFPALNVLPSLAES